MINKQAQDLIIILVKIKISIMKKNLITSNSTDNYLDKIYFFICNINL